MLTLIGKLWEETQGLGPAGRWGLQRVGWGGAWGAGEWLSMLILVGWYSPDKLIW